MMVPSNVVRCLVDNGPIKYPSRAGLPYECARCGAHMTAREWTSGHHWEESHGFLVEVETVDGPDTEEEIEELYGAFATLAAVFGDSMTALHVADKFTCSEADDIARSLMVGDQKRAALSFLKAHAIGDEEGDMHHDVADIEGYLRNLAGLPVHELVEEPESGEPAPTAEELLKLLNLDD